MSKETYLEMQRNQYETEAEKWTLENRDPVVGWYDQHEASPLYDEVLFRGIDTSKLYAVDYGCGPARCIIRFDKRFKCIDGVDIAKNNIRNARKNIKAANLDYKGKLVHTDGEVITKPDNFYDLAYSVICLQHIASHTIRFNIMKEINRVLKPDGWFCFQMGFGNRPNSVQYHDDHFMAPGTNGMCDVSVKSPSDLKFDLAKAGFKNFDFQYTDPICDEHEKWVWVKAQKV